MRSPLLGLLQRAAAHSYLRSKADLIGLAFQRHPSQTLYLLVFSQLTTYPNMVPRTLDLSTYFHVTYTFGIQLIFHAPRVTTPHHPITLRSHGDISGT